MFVTGYRKIRHALPGAFYDEGIIFACKRALFFLVSLKEGSSVIAGGSLVRSLLRLVGPYQILINCLKNPAQSFLKERKHLLEI